MSRTVNMSCLTMGTALVLSLALAGCAESTPQVARSSGNGSSAPQAASTTSASVQQPSDAPTSSTFATHSGSKPCDAANLNIQATIGRTGSTILLAFDNKGQGPCTLEGWPAVVLAHKSGVVVSKAERQHSFPDRLIALPSGGSAYAYVSYESSRNSDGSSKNCAAMGALDSELLVSLPSGSSKTVDTSGYQFCADRTQSLLVWRFMPKIEPLNVG